MKEPYTYKPFQFFLVVNLVMWATWLTAAYFSYQPGGGPGKLISLLEFIGLLSPITAALWMIFTSKSKELKQDFYYKLLDIRSIRLSTIPVIFLLMPAVMAISVLISNLFFGQPLDQLRIVKGSPFPAGIVPAQFLIFLAPLFEETGWKGYGMDSLRGNRTFFTATIIYAVLWLFWHVPLFFVNNYYHNTLIKMNPLFALNFAVSIFPAAVIINWIWYKNRGNILTAVLFHAVVNFQGILQMGQAAKCIETVILVIIAVMIVNFDKKIFFGRFREQIGYFS